MEKHLLQREVLIVISSRFARKKLLNKPVEQEVNFSFSKDQFEEAYPDGFLDNILTPSANWRKVPGKLFIWQLVIGDQFLCAAMAEEPFSCAAYLSVNPFQFFPWLPQN
jgi:hypothetical protein